MRRTLLNLAECLLESRLTPAFGDTLHALTDATPASGESFASAVAVSGNLALVGSPNLAVDGHSGAGVVHVFDLSNGTLLRTIPNPDPQADDHFGRVLAIDGTLAVIGVPDDDAAGGTGSGAVYVFDASTGALMQGFYDPNPQPLDGFGSSVAISGTRVAIGNPSDNLNGFGDVGSAFVFDAISGSQIAMVPNLTNVSEGFGTAVGIDGNLLAVGAPQLNAGGKSDVGAVHLFDATTGQFFRTIANPTPTSNDNFGEVLAFDGGRVVIGVPRADPGGVIGAGAAYLYEAATGSLVASLANPDPASSDDFGAAVSIGSGRVVVGAPGDDVGGVNSAGCAFLFALADGAALGAAANPAPAASDEFGRSVAVSGARLFVGVPRDNVASFAFAGRAFIVNAGQAPTLRNDFLTLDEDGDEAAIPVLLNDETAPNPGGTLTVLNVSAPANGTAGIIGGGTIVTYVPVRNFFGTDTFTYLAADEFGNFSNATVTVIVRPINDAPIISTFADLTTRSGVPVGPIPFTVLDPETTSANLTVSAASSNPSLVPLANIVFGGSGANRTVTIRPVDGLTGTTTIAITVSDGTGGTTTESFQFTVRPQPPAPSRNVVVSGIGGTGPMHVPDANGTYATTPEVSFIPFPGYDGAIRSAKADVNGDGLEDTVLVTGPGTPLRVMVIGGQSWYPVLVPAFDPFGGDFTGGGFVAAHDLDGNGTAEFVVTPDQGGGPRVSIFTLVGGDAVGVWANFLGIDDPNFRGGARPALGDLTGDGTPDLLVAAGFGGGPRVTIFDGTTLAGARSVIANFFAFPQDAATLRNGVFASLGDIDGDGRADAIFGGGPGGAPRIYILSGSAIAANSPTMYSQPVANFFVAGNASDRGGVRIAVKDADGDARADLIVGSGEGSPANVRIFLGRNFTSTAEPAVFQDLTMFGGQRIPGGLYVG